MTGREIRATRPAPTTLELRRTYAAPVALLWRLWTDPVHFARWWGPVGMRCSRCEIDLRPGGAWLATITGADGAEHTVAGVYLEIEPPHRLVYSWQWRTGGAPGRASKVTVTFTAAGEGCELRVLHEDLAPDAADAHLRGWTGCLESLAAHLSENPD